MSGNARRRATSFPEPWMEGPGALWGNWPTEVVEIAKLYEFDGNDRFFTASHDPHMGQTLKLF
jgi:hypothetical protein